MTKAIIMLIATIIVGGAYAILYDAGTDTATEIVEQTNQRTAALEELNDITRTALGVQ